MTIQTSTLRPGLLVQLKTSVRGNVSYARRDLETESAETNGAAVSKWETERKIADPAEHDAAGKARSKASNAIRSICAKSAFGLLCPEADKDRLDAAMTEARAIVDAFNATANLSRISIYVIAGRIAPDDVEAVKAINSEIRDLLDDMEQGVKNLDVAAIREAASKAKGLGAMLSPDAAARVQMAVEAARAAARKIVAAGETAAAEIDQRTIRRIAEQRTAFLDLDDAGDIAAPAASGRAVDLVPSDAPTPPTRAAVAPALEME